MAAGGDGPSLRFGKTGVGSVRVSQRFDARSMIRLATRTGQSFGPGFREALAGVHEQVATKIQQGMAQTLKTEVQETGRTQRGSNYLSLALLDPRNREVTASNFTVLRPSWMDKSHAERYWRQIEFGNTKEYDGYILFSNGGKAYGPWRENGTRSAGTQRNYSRPRPPGYKHHNLIQTVRGKGGWSSSIGPFPAYRYTRGGARVMRNTNMKAAYSQALSRVGIKMADVARAK